jgi:hypothetical protein
LGADVKAPSNASQGYEQYASPDIPSTPTPPTSVHRGHGDRASRLLQIYAFDPQLGRRRRFRISLEIPYEELERVPNGAGAVPADGVQRRTRPRGRLIDIVDYDAASDRYYELVDLDAPEVLAAGGLQPKVDDPKFHQQMVYAVAMKVVANFERALGRRLQFDRLTVLPHAFRGRNAFFHAPTDSLCFGYFRADAEDAGDNLPNQWIFTCLSHDIIAHEMTHAIVHRLRKRFLEATNPDVYAFHEAISDIVAIFQHFGFPGVLAGAVQEGRADLSRPGPLLELARQFGYSTGGGSALRRAREERGPDPDAYQQTFEPHDRGSILVRAVFDAFFATYAARVEDLIRIATGGSGVLGAGYLQSDLVQRITAEAGDTAQRVLDLCIRAFDYLPPVDVRFSDYLRALVTADMELNPEDPFDLRANLVDAFFAHGIHPEGVFSLNEESLLWDAPPPGLPDLDLQVLDQLTAFEAQRWGASRKARTVSEDLAVALHAYATANHVALGLAPHTAASPIAVDGFHTMFRVGSDGQLLTEAGVQLVQTPPAPKDVDLGGLVPRAGATVIFSGDGTPRWVIRKPLQLASDGASTKDDDRVAQMAKFVEMSDERDPHFAWAGASSGIATRMTRRYDFALVHQRVARRRDKGDTSGNAGKIERAGNGGERGDSDARR